MTSFAFYLGPKIVCVYVFLCVYDREGGDKGCFVWGTAWKGGAYFIERSLRQGKHKSLLDHLSVDVGTHPDRHESTGRDSPRSPSRLPPPRSPAICACRQRRKVDRFRLNIPVRVSVEGPGYVSTDEAMPPARPRRKAESDGKENREGALTDAVVSRAVDAPRSEEGTGGIIASSKGRKRCRGQEAEDEETVDTAAGRVVEFPHASTSGLRNGGTIDGAEANPDESEEGEIVMPAPQRSSLKRPSTPPPPPSPMSSRPEDEERSCGPQSSAPSRAYVPPSADRLCPLPSGPRKGAVILGLDCEMVSSVVVAPNTALSRKMQPGISLRTMCRTSARCCIAASFFVVLFVECGRRNALFKFVMLGCRSEGTAETLTPEVSP